MKRITSRHLHLPRKYPVFKGLILEALAMSDGAQKTLLPLRQAPDVGICLSSSLRVALKGSCTGDPGRSDTHHLHPGSDSHLPDISALAFCRLSREAPQNCCADKGDALPLKKEENFPPRPSWPETPSGIT